MRHQARHILTGSVSRLAAPVRDATAIDHSGTDLGPVPPTWITQAEGLNKVSYGHGVHGNGVSNGMDAIQYPPGTDGEAKGRSSLLVFCRKGTARAAPERNLFSEIVTEQAGGE